MVVVIFNHLGCGFMVDALLCLRSALLCRTGHRVNDILQARSNQRHYRSPCFRNRIRPKTSELRCKRRNASTNNRWRRDFDFGNFLRLRSAAYGSPIVIVSARILFPPQVRQLRTRVSPRLHPAGSNQWISKSNRQCLDSKFAKAS